MGFGFVVARFGLFLREIELANTRSASIRRASPYGSVRLLILIGVVVNVLSAFQHLQFVRAVKNTTEPVERTPTLAVTIALVLACTGVAMTVYLLFVR